MLQYTTDPHDVIKIVYDGECPVCTRFVRFLSQSKKRNAGIELIDARNNLDIVYFLEKEECIYIDNDFALFIFDKWHSGGSALSILVLLDQPNFQKLNLLIAKLLNKVYPILRYGRRLLLKVLGKKMIKPNRLTKYGDNNE
ncbi:DUF393 domain-containing protein [Vibrio alginolyticus]|nr:DUF393 domain-containing protein [Vibrio alginolyticus]